MGKSDIPDWRIELDPIKTEDSWSWRILHRGTVVDAGGAPDFGTAAQDAFFNYLEFLAESAYQRPTEDNADA